MRNIPLNILMVAKRIAANNGVSVEDVINKYRLGSRKLAFSRNDFFWEASDISLAVSEKNSIDFQRKELSHVAN